MNIKPSPDIIEILKLTHRKYNTKVSISKQKHPITKNYLSETISFQNKKQFKYVKPDTPEFQTKMFRTKITTFLLDLPEKPIPISKSFYDWDNNTTESYDSYPFASKQDRCIKLKPIPFFQHPPTTQSITYKNHIKNGISN